MRRTLLAQVATAALAAGAMASTSPAGASPAASSPGAAVAPPTSPTCHLGNGIKHVVQVQFDNVHLTRDNPDVPSDLEQMPALLSFLRSNGVVLANTHDVLVHTATNVLSNQTGLYPDRHGVAQSNSYSYYDKAGGTHTGISFGYWTAPIFDPSGSPADTRYNMDYLPSRTQPAPATDVNTPAPWTPFTEAGCNVGEVGTSNTVLENTATDVPTVFGPGSPQAAEAKSDPVKAQADLVGLAVHCAKASSLCRGGQQDRLPDEPGGYAGYRALFGNAQIQPAVHPSGPIQSTAGQPITDGKGHAGFPGFDSMTPDNALGYAATLLENGVQTVNVYVSDAHTDHTAAHTGDLGPGEKTYSDQLTAYNTAFHTFLTRMARHGMTPANTLFTVTSDEGDHFAGSAPQPAGCTGRPGNYCTYTTKSEVNVNLPGLLATTTGNITPFAIHNDPAPAIWIKGNPDRTSATARQLGRDIGKLTATDPYTGRTEPVAYSLADQVGEKILHFVTADPARTPSLTAFSGEDFYLGGGPPNCDRPCVYTSQGYAWNHGSYWKDMQTIFAGYVGPGVTSRGVDATTWTDQVDMRPTVLTLTGLHDRYQVDGRAVLEILSPSVLAPSVRPHRAELIRLGQAFKQLTAPTGAFAMGSLKVSTAAVKSSSRNDATYAVLESTLQRLGSVRDALGEWIGAALLQATEGQHPVSWTRLAELPHQASGLTRSVRGALS